MHIAPVFFRYLFDFRRKSKTRLRHLPALRAVAWIHKKQKIKYAFKNKGLEKKSRLKNNQIYTKARRAKICLEPFLDVDFESVSSDINIDLSNKDFEEIEFIESSDSSDDDESVTPPSKRFKKE